MPKLRNVEITNSSMSWDSEKGHPINLRKISRAVFISVPKRELETFLDQGKTIKKITIELS
jgi:hypothetical protein